MPVCSGIGNTPLIQITDQIYAKLETVNPSGSVKDRMACYLLDKAAERGEISKGSTIIEATSGNTGIAFSMLCADRGYKMIVVMPSNMSDERKRMIKSFGAEIIEVGAGDFAGAVEKRDAMAAELGAFVPKQFSNPENAEGHKLFLGQEMIKQINEQAAGREVSALVAGTGTGGTLMGVRMALIEKYSSVKTVAVEPTESAVMKGEEPGAHGIQGIGDGFIPPIVDMNLVDEVVTVSTEESIERAKKLAKDSGTFVGISSGANVLAAEKYIEKFNPSGVVLTILPDRMERYLSMV